MQRCARSVPHGGTSGLFCLVLLLVFVSDMQDTVVVLNPLVAQARFPMGHIKSALASSSFWWVVGVGVGVYVVFVCCENTFLKIVVSSFTGLLEGLAVHSPKV